MGIQTHVHDARARVRSEQDAVEARLDAVDRFLDRVEAIAPGPTPSSPGSVVTTVGTRSRHGRSRSDTCETVRQAFAETIRPHSLEDAEQTESLQETIQAELSGPIAVALAPATETTVSPELKRAVLSEARARRAETEALGRALEREATQVDDAAAVVDEITEWIATADETPLTDLGFAELRARHERLERYRGRCEAVTQRRQSFLDGATSNGPDAGISHRSLGPYIYQDFPTDHPVLATVARLDDTCKECQRAVRDHLVRRA
jgi:hypothetical protein